MKKSSSSRPTKPQQSSGSAVGKATPTVELRAIKPQPQPASQAAESLASRKERSSSFEPRLVEFAYTSPSASEVSLVGDFNNWQPGASPMRKQRGGKWSAELPLRPGRYEYRLVVDGQWREDPVAERSVPNPFGGLNSVKVVSPGGASEVQA